MRDLHNRRNRQDAEPSDVPRFLTAFRAGKPEHTPEAEGVLVEWDEHAATFTLDDGETVVFDRVELLAHLGISRAVVAALDATRDDLARRHAA